MLLEIKGVTDDWKCKKCGGIVEGYRGYFICTSCMTTYLARNLRSDSALTPPSASSPAQGVQGSETDASNARTPAVSDTGTNPPIVCWKCGWPRAAGMAQCPKCGDCHIAKPHP
jgi:Zn finger protein HypA/HybF involved in hydrogenase expression